MFLCYSYHGLFMLSPPQTMSSLLLLYNKIEKKTRTVRKSYNVRVFQNCTLMVTALSPQNKELTSKDVHVPKKVIFETYLLVIFFSFINFHCRKHMDLLLNHNYLKIVGLIITNRVITFTIRCQNKSCSFISWILVYYWRHFILTSFYYWRHFILLVKLLNAWEIFYSMGNFLNVSKIFSRSKMTLQDCTY